MIPDQLFMCITTDPTGYLGWEPVYVLCRPSVPPQTSSGADLNVCKTSLKTELWFTASKCLQCIQRLCNSTVVTMARHLGTISPGQPAPPQHGNVKRDHHRPHTHFLLIALQNVISQRVSGLKHLNTNERGTRCSSHTENQLAQRNYSCNTQDYSSSQCSDASIWLFPVPVPGLWVPTDSKCWFSNSVYLISCTPHCV